MSLEELLPKILTEYGPLGFGWVIAFLFWRRIEKLQDTIVELTEKGIAAQVTGNSILDAFKHRLGGSS